MTVAGDLEKIKEEILGRINIKLVELKKEILDEITEAIKPQLDVIAKKNGISRRYRPVC